MFVNEIKGLAFRSRRREAPKIMNRRKADHARRYQPFSYTRKEFLRPCIGVPAENEICAHAPQSRRNFARLFFGLLPGAGGRWMFFQFFQSFESKPLWSREYSKSVRNCEATWKEKLRSRERNKPDAHASPRECS